METGTKTRNKPASIKGRAVFVVAHQMGTDSETVAVLSTKRAALDFACSCTRTAAIMRGFPDGGPRLRGLGQGEIWVDLVEDEVRGMLDSEDENDGNTLVAALYTINRMRVDVDFH